MKKFISILLLVALLLCACDSDQPVQTMGSATETSAPETTEATQATDAPGEFADVNELEPVDGVYQICSIVGLQNMANHLDAEFVLLCDIDLGGANLTPVGTQTAPFTGELDGGNFTVSNFTIDTAAEGDLGFFGVNAGKVKNLGLANVTVTADASTRNAGVLAGNNTGDLSRCTVSGTLTVSQAAAGAACGTAAGAACGTAAGTSTGDIRNCNLTVDLSYTASGTACIGGLAGIAEGSKLQYSDVGGRLEVTDGTGKTVGLLAGTAKDAEIKGCAFVGEANTVDGVLHTALAGAEENAEITKCLLRDNSAEPLAEEVQALRAKAEQTMRAMGSVKWYVSETLYRSCNCDASSCYGAFYPGTLHEGIPYNHKAGSLARMLYCMDEDGFIKDWVYDAGDFDGYDLYMGCDCSTAVQKAWATVSNTISFTSTRTMPPSVGAGCLPVGDWAWDIETSSDLVEQYKQYREATGEQALYEAYALMRMGDAIVNQLEEGGHARMIAQDAVVVRDQEGNIDPTYSYVLCHEQGYTVRDDNYYSTWRLDHKFTFANLYETYYMPVTCEEFLTGEMETPEAKLEGGIGGKAGLTTGIVKANYFLDSVDMVITDASGKEVFNKTMFSTVEKYYNTYSSDLIIRSLPTQFDMASFAVTMMSQTFELGQTYHCTVTANLGTGDSFVVKDYSFTHGVVE